MPIPLANQQVISAYEQEHCSMEEIADMYNMEVSAVEFALMEGSSVYRKSVKGEVADVTDVEAKDMMDIMKGIARDYRNEMPGVSLRAAQFVYNEAKGRNSVAVGNGQTINILMINDRLKNMKQARALAMREVSSEKEAIAV